MQNKITVINTVLQEAVIYLDGRHVTFKTLKREVDIGMKETKNLLTIISDDMTTTTDYSNVYGN